MSADVSPSFDSNSPPADCYQPRRTPDTDFYRIVDEHFDEFREVYPERYREDFGYWRPVIDEVVSEFLKCGVIEEGFARLRCPDCEQEMFVTFSCKQRGFCPSCHQKRALELSNHLNENVYEKVPHHQYVFTIPKRFRIYARYDRSLLGEMARCAWRTIRDVYGYVLGPTYTPGAVVSIQTFGSLMLWNPHIHGIVTDGGFDDDGAFKALDDVPAEPFKKVWEHHVFRLLIDRDLIQPELAEDMRTHWNHTGFSAHNDVSVQAGDEDGLTRITEYVARCPVSESKIQQDDPDDPILYDAEHSNPLPFQQWRALAESDTTKRNFEVFDPLDFLAQVTQHIPNRNQHMIRYYGWYSNKSRGMRAQQARTDEEMPESMKPDPAGASSIAWATLIENVYDVDPLVCPECHTTMVIVEVAEKQADIQRILQDMDGDTTGSDPPRAPPQGSSYTYEPFHEDLPWEERS